MKQEFVKIRALVCELADVLDTEFPSFVVEEDKTLRYKQMVIVSSPDKNQDGIESGANQQENGQGQPLDGVQQYLDRRHQQPKPKFFPFDDELSFNFYRKLPDFSNIMLSAEEAAEILRIEKLDDQELMEEEIKRIQAVIEQQERDGQQPDEMPEEDVLLERVNELRKKTINQWCDAQFDEFRRKMQKSQSMQQMDKKAEEYLTGNNSVILKASRR